MLAALQVDHRGQRSRPVVEKLLNSEAARDAIGQVAVPFGICTEPTNVKAHGQVCPFRHQCLGCSYFRSDPSFLPELRSYLNSAPCRQGTAPGGSARARTMGTQRRDPFC